MSQGWQVGLSWAQNHITVFHQDDNNDQDGVRAY
jgi:hypothetical protein